jgi:hypothetical protein
MATKNQTNLPTDDKWKLKQYVHNKKYGIIWNHLPLVDAKKVSMT